MKQDDRRQMTRSAPIIKCASETLSQWRDLSFVIAFPAGRLGPEYEEEKGAISLHDHDDVSSITA